MTQAQRTQTGANSLVPTAVAGLVMAAALAGAILVYGLPTINLAPGSGTTNHLATSEEAWMQQQLAQSAAFDVMSGANRASADRWEAMQDALTVHSAAKSSTFTEAQRQAVLRHQLIDPDAVSDRLRAAVKLQVEREYIDRQTRSATERIITPTDPKIR